MSVFGSLCSLPYNSQECVFTRLLQPPVLRTSVKELSACNHCNPSKPLALESLSCPGCPSPGFGSSLQHGRRVVVRGLRQQPAILTSHTTQGITGQLGALV